MLNLIFEKNEFPVFQNRMYDSKEEATACLTGNTGMSEIFKRGLSAIMHLSQC
jgi:hypothetical protein